MRNLWNAIKHWNARQEARWELIKAVRKGDTNAALLLLDQTTDREQQCRDANRFLSWALEGSHVEMARALLQRGADIDPHHLYDWDSFTHVILGGSLEMVQLFLDHGADVNTKDPEHEITVLMYAAMSGYLEIVRLLLDHGAEINAYDYEGRTALTHAKEAQQFNVVQLLKQRGGKEEMEWEEQDANKMLLLRPSERNDTDEKAQLVRAALSVDSMIPAQEHLRASEAPQAEGPK